MEIWQDGDETVVHVVALDVVASGKSEQDAIDRAGTMIEQLLDHFLEEIEAETVTEDEMAQFELLLKRLGPLALRAHRRERIGDILRAIARMIGRSPHDWGIGRPSTHDASRQALHV